MNFDEVKRSFDRDCRIGVEPLLVSATVEIFDNRRNPGCEMTSPPPTEATAGTGAQNGWDWALLSNWGRVSRIFDLHSRCPQNVPKNLVPSPTSRRRHSGDIRTFYSMVVRDGDFYFFTILHFSFFLFLVIAQQSFAKMFFI